MQACSQDFQCQPMQGVKNLGAFHGVKTRRLLLPVQLSKEVSAMACIFFYLQMKYVHFTWKSVCWYESVQFPTLIPNCCPFCTWLLAAHTIRQENCPFFSVFSRSFYSEDVHEAADHRWLKWRYKQCIIYWATLYKHCMLLELIVDLRSHADEDAIHLLILYSLFVSFACQHPSKNGEGSSHVAMIELYIIIAEFAATNQIHVCSL